MSAGGQNIIELGFDIEKLTEEKKQVLDLFVDLFGKLQAYDGTKFNPLGNGGLADLRKSITDGAAAMGEYQKTIQKYNDTVTEQAKKQNEAKKANDALTASGKETASAIGSQASAYDQLIKQAVKNQQTQKELAQSIKDAERAFKAGETTAEQYAASMESIKAAQLSLKVSNADINKTLLNLEKQSQSAAGANNELSASLNLLIQQYDKLSGAEKEGDGGKQLLKQIQDIDKALKESEGDTGRFQRNVGNYSSAFKEAFGGLASELANVNKQLAEMESRGKSAATNLTGSNPIGFDTGRHKEGGDVTNRFGSSAASSSILPEDAAAYQKLTVQQKVLEGSLQRQTIGFKTANQEMRNAKTTLDALTLAGLQHTEAFEKLNLTYTTAQSKVKDLHEEQSILTSDAPGLTALTGVAKGIGGVYAAGAGAAALFADGNEKVEKELQKLVAIMTFLQGLEEATKTLKERNALATALQTEAEKALVAIKKIEIAIFGNSATVTKAEAEAKVISTEATTANTEALEANAIGAELTAGAVEGVAVAEGVATTATIAFRTALISTGIGAIIIGLIYGVTKLVGAISDWIGEDERAEKANLDLAESNSKLLETFKQLQEVYDKAGKERIEQLMREAELTKAAGKNQFIQLDDELRINDARRENAKKFVDQYKITEKTVSDLDQKRKFDLQTQQGFEESLSIAQQKLRTDSSSANKKQVESLQKLAEQAEKDAKNSSTKYLIAAEAYKEYINALNEGDAIRLRLAKAAADELAKITGDAAQRRYEIEKAANDRILNAPTSTEDQRLGAIKASYDAEEKLANSQIIAIQKNIKDQAITERDGADQILNIRNALNIKYKATLDQYLKTQIEFNDRRLDAENTVKKNGNESDAAVQDAITKDLQQELESRLGALNIYVADKAKIIADDYTTEIAKAKEKNTTSEEYAAIESNRQRALAELTADTQKRIYDITISYGEKRLKAIQDLNKAPGQEQEVTTDFNDQTDALNQSLLNQKISYSKYLREKRDLNREYIAEKDAADVEDDQRNLKRIQNEIAKEAEIRNGADANLAIAENTGDPEAIANAKAEVAAISETQDKFRAEEKTANDQLNKDKKKQNDDAVKEREQAEQQLAANIQQIQEKAFDVATSLVNGAYETRINHIQHTMELEDAAADNQIAAVQKSTLSERDAAAETIILESQKQARDTAQKREMAKEKQKEAKFDRDMSVAKAVWSTGEAIMKTFEEYGGTPIAYAIAASIAALGAVEVATILSQPIPTYAEGIGIPGKGQHPGGLAWVGEEYKPEEVKIPGREPFIVSEPTLLNMPRQSSVTPLDMYNIVNEIGWGAYDRGAAIVNAVVMDSGSQEIVGALDRHGARMERAFKKSQRKINNIVHVHVADPVWENYLDQKVRGKR